VKNLAFDASLALAGLALISLTGHELSSERVTHPFEVTDTQRDHNVAAAG
jgi:hypothetical protein